MLCSSLQRYQDSWGQCHISNDNTSINCHEKFLRIILFYTNGKCYAVPMWWPRKKWPQHIPCMSQRWLKWIPGVHEYSWATLSPGDINIEAWSTSLWLEMKLIPSPCKTTTVIKPQEMRAGWNEKCSPSKNKCLDLTTRKPKQQMEWSGETLLGQSRLETGCSTNMMIHYAELAYTIWTKEW